MDGFLPEEIEVIFAHEIGHHVFHHIRQHDRWRACSDSAAGFWVCDRLLAAWVAAAPGRTTHGLPVATLPLLLLILTVFAMLLQPLQNRASRRYERQRDRYALERTRA